MSSSESAKYTIPKTKLQTGLICHIILVAFLNFIWLWPWVYRTTDLLNGVKGEEHRSPSSNLLLFIFIPFYSVYWFYKTARQVEILGAQARVDISFAGLCAILALFFPPLASIFVQMEIERLSDCEFDDPTVRIKRPVRQSSESRVSNIKPPASKVSERVAPTEQKASNKPSLVDKVEAIEKNLTTVVCSNCNFEQSKDRTVCWKCGAKFVKPLVDLEQKELHVVCPGCNENLYFTGNSEGDEVKCPFCDKAFVI